MSILRKNFHLNFKQEAENSIKFYQNLSGDKKHCEMLQIEMNLLRNTINETDKSGGDSFSWSDLITNPGRKGLIIALGVAILSQFCGIPGLIAYTTTIFKEAGSNVSPDRATIIVGIIQFFGSCITTNFVDRAGRKVRIIFYYNKKHIFIQFLFISFCTQHQHSELDYVIAF